MINIELRIDEDFNRETLETFLKLSHGCELHPAYDENCELTGIWARING